MTRRPGLVAGAPFLADPAVRRILSLLNDAGEQARVVGGAVRNTLMGLTVSDIDIATTAVPQLVMRRAAAAGIHAVPTGIEHGTVTLVVAGAPHEVTTLREDIETDGRRAVVRFGRDFAQDALRRDFTINALGADADGTVHDYAGGLVDIAARRVRFIGDADARIREDVLRILRLFRFSAAYGDGTVDAAGLAAAGRNKAGLDRLSRERIRQETLKLLVQPQAAAVLDIMAAGGFLDPVLGGPADVARFRRLVAIEAALGERASPVRRLFALAAFAGDDAARLRERLKLSNAENERLSALAVSGAARPAIPCPPPTAVETAASERALLYRLGPETYRDRVVADWLDAGAPADDPARSVAYRLPDRWTAPKFPISGADLLAAGLNPGPAVGETLRRLESDWIAAGMPEGAAVRAALLAGLGTHAPQS